MIRLRKTLFALLVIVLSAAPAVRAQIIAEGAVVTDYMWRGYNVLNGAPAFQPTVTGILGETGFDVNAWFSFALRDREQQAIRDLDEMDLTLTYSRSIGMVDVRAGVFTYHLFTHDEYPDADFTFVREAFGGVTFTSLPLSPWVVYNYELVDAGGNDWYLELGADQSVSLPMNQELLLSLHAGWYSAEWAGLGGQLTDLSLTVGLPVIPVHGDGTWLSPWMMAAYTPPEHVNPNQFEVVAGMTLSGVFLAR
ncbi:hypothetical protein KQI52_13665 [bacterium]|nr:hypothetical protein [bacterium]